VKIIKGNSDIIPKSNYNIVTIGFFDGVHRGHKKILKTLVNKARINKGKSIVVTFWPHPRSILNQNENLKFLSTLQEKIQALEKIGIDYLYIINFSSRFSKMKAEDFIKNILENKLRTDCLVIGYNHHFGYKREGNTKYLKRHINELNFNLETIPKQQINQSVISSTKIRSYLSEGKIHLSNQLLGREYSLSGTVVKGDGIGKKINFPTANISLDEHKKIIPKNGVYAAKILIQRKVYFGMVNIGYRPTRLSKKKTIEINIFEFNSSIYKKKISLKFFKRLREEIKFKDLDALKKQLTIDKKNSLSILNKTT